jgi:hypothetical protein
LASNTVLGWSPTPTVLAGNDLILARDAANTLALRNGTNAQEQRWYYSYTDAGNNAYFSIDVGKSSASYTKMSAISNGATSAPANLQIAAGSGTGSLEFSAGGSLRFYSQSGLFNPSSNGETVLGDSTHLWKSVGIAESIQGSKTKALTESSATTVFTISLADKAVTSGHVTWAVHAADASNTQMVSNEFGFDCLNESDTEACTINNFGTDTDNTPTGTLTCTDAWSYGTNNASFTLNCVSSLTQTTLNAYVRLDMLVTQDVSWP